MVKPARRTTPTEAELHVFRGTDKNVCSQVVLSEIKLVRFEDVLDVGNDSF